MQKTRLTAGNSLEPIRPQSRDEIYPNLKVLKTNWIGQSASKARIEQGSETIPSGSRTSVRKSGVDKMENVVYTPIIVNCNSLKKENTMRKNAIKEYRIWKGMKSRCYAPCNKDIGNYQKNNITVCDRWKNSYDNFLEDMGRIPNNDYSIERINNDGNYEPTNCKWVHKSEQPKNRGNLKIFYHNNEYKTLKDWSKYFGIKYTTLYSRIYRYGLSFENAIRNDPFKRMISRNGETMILKAWCKKLNRRYVTVVDRIHKGWDIERALTTVTPKPFC